ncbi:MAG: hypothetical protein PHG66_01835 [Candidatus Colwellbacteria bacterium]|nr:hypothetical protein [Candidatus Colwellbacteria bacterium]
MPRVNRFSGPIEDIVGSTCPGASYCAIDQCYRNGGVCGNTGSCCLTSANVKDLVTALGCGGSTSFSAQRKFSTLSEDPTAMNTCITQLGLTGSDVDYMCTNLSADDCFSEICALGCTNHACPSVAPPSINLQTQVCQTIQQYCDVIDPSLLSDPNYSAMCCSIDPIAGVPDRTVCGCPGNPCSSNPVVMQNVQALKASAAQYWKNNPVVSSPVLPSSVNGPSPPVVQPTPVPVQPTPVPVQPTPVPVQPTPVPVQPTPVPPPKESGRINIKRYLMFIILLLLLVGGGLYWYFVYKKNSGASDSSHSYLFSPSDQPLGNYL